MIQNITIVQLKLMPREAEGSCSSHLSSYECNSQECSKKSYF